MTKLKFTREKEKGFKRIKRKTGMKRKTFGRRMMVERPCRGTGVYTDNKNYLFPRRRDVDLFHP